MNAHFDVIIIGTGAGGGALLHRLAASGKRILVLERGPFLPREKDNWNYHGSFKYYSSEVMFNKDGGEIRPGFSYFVGGNTKVYGAALFRLREKDFEQFRHRDGIWREVRCRRHRRAACDAKAERHNCHRSKSSPLADERVRPRSHWRCGRSERRADYVHWRRSGGLLRRRKFVGVAAAFGERQTSEGFGEQQFRSRWAQPHEARPGLAHRCFHPEGQPLQVSKNDGDQRLLLGRTGL